MKNILITSLIASTIAGQAFIPTPQVSEDRNVDLLTITRPALSAMQDEVEKELVRQAEEEERLRLEEEKARLEAERLEAERLEEVRKSSVTFNPNNLLEVSGIHAYELENVLLNTSEGHNMVDYAKYFVEAEQIYGVNALFLCAIAAQESGWARYAAGNGTNLTGYAVYNSTSEGKTFEGGIRENILETGRLLKEHYLTEGGAHYNGIDIRSVNIRYCLDKNYNVDYNWSESISSIASMLNDIYHSIR